MAAAVYCNIFELLIVTIFHGFCSSIMLAMKWGLHVSILKLLLMLLVAMRTQDK
jgi:hypothetical protein